jgi:hypothetical protein
MQEKPIVFCLAVLVTKRFQVVATRKGCSGGRGAVTNPALANRNPGHAK